MTAQDFIFIQDHVLKLNGRELSEATGFSQPAISLWRSGERPISESVERTLELLQAERLRDIPVPMTIEDLVRLSRLAEQRQTTVESLLHQIIRDALHGKTIYHPAAIPADRAADSPDTNYKPRIKSKP